MRSAIEVKIFPLLPCCSFISRYVCPVLVSVLAISATLIVTMSILHWNYVENNQRKISKKMIILNHWYQYSSS